MSERIKNQLNVDGYCVTRNAHRITKKVQGEQLVDTNHRMVQAKIVVANMMSIAAGNPRLW